MGQDIVQCELQNSVLIEKEYYNLDEKRKNTIPDFNYLGHCLESKVTQH